MGVDVMKTVKGWFSAYWTWTMGAGIGHKIVGFGGVALVALMIFGAVLGGEAEEEPTDTTVASSPTAQSDAPPSSVEASQPTNEPSVTLESTPTPEPTSTPESTPTPEPTSTPEPTPTPALSLGQSNAIRSAESYLSFTSFSRQGLIDQLEFEGFSVEDATFAVDNIVVDWNEQAALKAESYLSISAFSRQGLIDQLVFEGFTPEQAEYGVSAVGY